MSALFAPYFHDEAAAFTELEATLWPNGPVCPRCGGTERITSVKGGRMGLRRCGPCKRQFTVTVGTMFEASHVKLNLWLQAVYLMCSSKKGISSHQLMRTLDVQYKTAWFMTHRIREAMRDGTLSPMGGEGAVVEVDERFIGQKKDMPKQRGYAHKHAVLTLVERGKGSRSFHVEGSSAADLLPIAQANANSKSQVMTDEAGQYVALGKHFAGHDYTRHGKGEYVRGAINTNTVEDFYSVFKRSMKDVYQHCSKRHLHCCAAEFDFRYNNWVKLGVDDKARTSSALRGIVGKTLTYHGSPSAMWSRAGDAWRSF